MFSLFKRRKFEPDFPIIDLAATSNEVLEALSAYSTVEQEENSRERSVDYSYVSIKGKVRISVGISGDSTMVSIFRCSI